jgi:hypothetical protein
VRFSIWGHGLCKATTNSQGLATCTAFGIFITLGPATYTVTYDGNGNYLATSITGRL